MEIKQVMSGLAVAVGQAWRYLVGEPTGRDVRDSQLDCPPVQRETRSAVEQFIAVPLPEELALFGAVVSYHPPGSGMPFKYGVWSSVAVEELLGGGDTLAEAIGQALIEVRAVQAVPA